MATQRPHDPEIEALAAMFASPEQDAKKVILSAGYDLAACKRLASRIDRGEIIDLPEFLFTRDRQVGRIGYFVKIKPIVVPSWLNIVAEGGRGFESRADWMAAATYRLGADPKEVTMLFGWLPAGFAEHVTVAGPDAVIDLNVLNNDAFKIGRRMIVASVREGAAMGNENTWLEVDAEEIPPHAMFIDLVK